MLSKPFVVSNFTKEPLGDITIFPLEYSSRATLVIVLFLTGSLEASESALTNTLQHHPWTYFQLFHHPFHDIQSNYHFVLQYLLHQDPFQPRQL